MRPKLITGAVLLLVATLVFALKCSADNAVAEPSEPGLVEPSVLDPNATSPDEQGESGSLIEAKERP